MKTTMFLALTLVWMTILANLTPAATPAPVAVGTVKAALKADAELEWKKTLAEARKEGSVVVIGGTTVAHLKAHAIAIVKAKFGIDLETLSVRGGEQRNKIIAERARGMYNYDITTSGASVHWDLKQLGFLDRLDPLLMLPEVTDPNKWIDKRLPWGDDDKTTLIWSASPNQALLINTKLVRPGEIKSYQDLLNPKWKGKIMMNDPTTEGTGEKYSVATLYLKMVNIDFYRRLANDQKVTISRDQRLQVEWVARGKMAISLFPSPGNAAPFIEAKAPLAWVDLEEGTLLAGAGAGFSVLKNAPHPNAAKVFVNWFLSKEGQQIIQDAADKQSQRVDVATDKLTNMRMPGVKYVLDPSENEIFALSDRAKIAKTVHEIFTPLRQ